MSTLRWYQQQIKNEIYEKWEDPGTKNVLAVAPTGAGKTVIMGSVARDYTGHGVAIAHRRELVSQISTALAREGVPHNLHVPPPVRSEILRQHIEATGRRWYDKNAQWNVAGVDGLAGAANDPWLKRIGLVMMDEAHHVLTSNKWGKAFALFTNAYGLGVTATPTRADKKGLGADSDGIFHSLIHVVDMRTLIDQGYLTDYRIIAPDPSDLHLEQVEIGASGDYKAKELSQHFRDNPKIIGDVVKHYLEWAKGKLGVTFAVDIAEATKIAEEFRRQGVPAEVLHGKTPPALRASLLRRFAARDFLQLVSVDILGEGFDLPAIEVISFARPTASFSLYAQQFGRVLRLMLPKELLSIWESLTIPERLEHIARSIKPKAIIIDHVGNVIRHMGAPDRARNWTLDREGRASRVNGDAIPLRNCLNAACMEPYERFYTVCPHCGTPAPEPAERSAPAMVDGDLIELTPEVLAKMRGEIARIDGTAVVPNLAPHIQASIIAKHHERITVQRQLREMIAYWAGMYREDSDRTNQRRFYLTFGIDVASACALNATEATGLMIRIQEKLQ